MLHTHTHTHTHRDHQLRSELCPLVTKYIYIFIPFLKNQEKIHVEFTHEELYKFYNQVGE